MHVDTARYPSTRPSRESLISQALASVTRRLYADFQPDITMADVCTTVRHSRQDLDIVTDPALPEFVERLARQRLSNRHAGRRHEHH